MASKCPASTERLAIDRKLITIKDVKTVGEHTATVRLHKEVSVTIPVTVIGDAPVAAPAEEPAPAPAAEAEPEVEEPEADEPEAAEEA